MKLRQILFIIILSCGFLRLSAQNVEYGAALDTMYMLIGDQQHLSFKVRTDTPLKIVFPQLKDTVVRGVEIVEGPRRDSVKEKDGKWLYEETYVITSFDTGVYVLPSMPITVEGDNYNNVLRTEPIGFVVNTYEVDEQKGNYDIVMPYGAPWNFREILPYLLWGLLGLAVIGGAWWYIARRKKDQPLFRREKEVIPPYVRAIQELETLKAEKLWQSGRVKDYYTKLTDTLRQYLNDELKVPAMEQTSFETLRDLEKCAKIDAQEREKFAVLLNTADFVKFAKAMPLPDENAKNLDVAYDFLNRTNERISAEKQAELAKQREEEQREQETEGKEK